jgi:hypothetical protein
MLARAAIAFRTIAVLAVVACGSPGTADDGSSTSETSDGSACADETRDDEYVLGLERSGEQLTVRFVDALPAPPARFDNTWTIEVLDLVSRTPVDDVELEVEPIMIDHAMHGTSIVAHVTDLEAPGQLELDPVNLFMPGLWEVRLHFMLASGMDDVVVFRFCVDP